DSPGPRKPPWSSVAPPVCVVLSTFDEAGQKVPARFERANVSGMEGCLLRATVTDRARRSLPRRRMKSSRARRALCQNQATHAVSGVHDGGRTMSTRRFTLATLALITPLIAGAQDWKDDAPGKTHRIDVAALPAPGATP